MNPDQIASVDRDYVLDFDLYQDLFGDRFIAPYQVSQIIGYPDWWAPDEKYLPRRPRFPLKLLESLRESHLLIAGLPITLLDMLSQRPDFFSQSIQLYRSSFFAEEENVRCGWHLMPVNPSERFRGREPKELLELFRLFWPETYLPSVAELVFAALIIRISSGRYLWQEVPIVAYDHIEHCWRVLRHRANDQETGTRFELSVLQEPSNEFIGVVRGIRPMLT